MDAKDWLIPTLVFEGIDLQCENSGVEERQLVWNAEMGRQMYNSNQLKEPLKE